MEKSLLFSSALLSNKKLFKFINLNSFLDKFVELTLFIQFVETLLDALIHDVIIIVHILIDYAVGCDLNYAVGNGIDKLVVMRCHQYDALVVDQRVVKRLYSLKVEVVGR